MLIVEFTTEMIGLYFEGNSYTLDEFRSLSNKLKNDILNGIEKPKSDDFKSQYEVFSEICKRLSAHIVYDHDSHEKRIETGKASDADVYTLRNGILKGSCVCDGYAKILKLALDIYGIECERIYGDPKITDEEKASSGDRFGHAWNQVKIGGQWFNFDLTWERDEIVREGKVDINLLRSDTEFQNHDKYSEDRPTYIHPCDTSVYQMADIDTLLLFAGSAESKEKILLGLDNDEKKKYIDNPELLGKFDSPASYAKIEKDAIIAKLILSTDDMEYIKQCITERKVMYKIGDLVISTGDKDYMKHWIETTDTYDKPYGIPKVAIATGDSEFIKSVMARDNIEFDEDDLYKMAMATKEPKFIAQCFENGMFSEYVTQDDLLESVIARKDPSFLEGWLAYTKDKTLIRKPQAEIAEPAQQENSPESTPPPINDGTVTTIQNITSESIQDNRQLLGRLIDKGIHLFRITKSELQEMWFRFKRSVSMKQEPELIEKGDGENGYDDRE